MISPQAFARPAVSCPILPWQCAITSGRVITETIFAWPGIGRYAWEGARNVDLNVVMGVTLVVALVYSLVNLAVDVLYSALDPRVRLS